MSRGLLIRLIAIVVISLFFPLVFTAHGLYSGSRVERLALEQREAQLEQVVSGIADELDRPDSARIREVLEESLADRPGIRAGVFAPGSGTVVTSGELKWYGSPPQNRGALIPPRSNPAVDYAASTGDAVTQRVKIGRGEGLVHALPVVVAGERMIVWAEETLQPDFHQERTLRRWAFILTIAGFLVALAGALYLSGSLGRGINRIMNGLEQLKHDLSYRLPPMSGELGQVAGAINRLGQKLQEKERLEEQLQRSARLASLGHLTAGVAHEIRNPLGIIKGTAQLMAQEYGDVPGLRDDVAVILEQVERQNRVLKDLLDFARPARPEVQEADLNALLESVLSFSRKFLEQKDLTLTTRLAPDLPKIPVDGERIKQVFLNFLLNAAEAMPGGGTVTIESRALDGAVAVSFADTGPGISREVLDHIFDPFYTTKSDGTGLGLAISHQIVAMHGGRIEVETGERGTIFTVVLPAGERRDTGAAADPGDRR